MEKNTRVVIIGAGYQRLYALQGLHSTYYTGELFANIGVESACHYSEQMIRKYFN